MYFIVSCIIDFFIWLKVGVARPLSCSISSNMTFKIPHALMYSTCHAFAHQANCSNVGREASEWERRTAEGSLPKDIAATSVPLFAAPPYIAAA